MYWTKQWTSMNEYILIKQNIDIRNWNCIPYKTTFYKSFLKSSFMKRIMNNTQRCVIPWGMRGICPWRIKSCGALGPLYKYAPDENNSHGGHRGQTQKLVIIRFSAPSPHLSHMPQGQNIFQVKQNFLCAFLRVRFCLW